MLTGEVEMWSGPALPFHQVTKAGVPHVAANRSLVEPVTAMVARTDPSEQATVVLQPELDALVPDLERDGSVP